MNAQGLHILHAQKMLITITVIISPSCSPSYLLSNEVGSRRGEWGVLMLISSPHTSFPLRKEICSMAPEVV